jgi:hypothetical protein
MSTRAVSEPVRSKVSITASALVQCDCNRHPSPIRKSVTWPVARRCPFPNTCNLFSRRYSKPALLTLRTAPLIASCARCRLPARTGYLLQLAIAAVADYYTSTLTLQWQTMNLSILVEVDLAIYNTMEGWDAPLRLGVMLLAVSAMLCAVESIRFLTWMWSVVIPLPLCMLHSRAFLPNR